MVSQPFGLSQSALKNNRETTQLSSSVSVREIQNFLHYFDCGSAASFLHDNLPISTLAHEQLSHPYRRETETVFLDIFAIWTRG